MATSITLSIHPEEKSGFLVSKQKISAAADRLSEWNPQMTADGLTLRIQLSVDQQLDEVVAKVRALLQNPPELSLKLSTVREGLPLRKKPENRT